MNQANLALPLLHRLRLILNIGMGKESSFQMVNTYTAFPLAANSFLAQFKLSGSISKLKRKIPPLSLM
jgi:hypothetical protein